MITPAMYPCQVQELLSSTKKRGSVAFKDEAEAVDRKVYSYLHFSLFVAYNKLFLACGSSDVAVFYDFFQYGQGYKGWLS